MFNQTSMLPVSLDGPGAHHLPEAKSWAITVSTHAAV